MRVELIIAFAGMTAATYFSRALFTVSVSRIGIPSFWERYLSFIPFAVLTAMVIPYLVLPENSNTVSLVNPWTISGGLTLFISYRTRSLVLSVGCGIAVFLILGKFFS
jgi:branched-subunit amino acid transport protein